MAQSLKPAKFNFTGWSQHELQARKGEIFDRVFAAARSTKKSGCLSQSEAELLRRELNAVEAALTAFDASVLPAEAEGWQP